MSIKQSRRDEVIKIVRTAGRNARSSRTEGCAKQTTEDGRRVKDERIEERRRDFGQRIRLILLIILW